MSLILVVSVRECLDCSDHRFRTFSVVAEAHLGLTQTDRVLALADAIELFKLGLVDALQEGIS